MLDIKERELKDMDIDVGECVTPLRAQVICEKAVGRVDMVGEYSPFEGDILNIKYILTHLHR